MAQKEAQQITEGIFLGPHQIAQDAVELGRLGIDTVLSVLGPDQEFEKVAVPPGDKVWCQVTDQVEAEADMRDRLPDAIETLLTWNAAGKVTYVHCQSGISRSATVVIAFMMKKHGMGLMEAYGSVWEKRPVINPNDGFFRVLQHFAETSCGVVCTEVEKHAETQDYNAYQLVSQLAFAGVTLEQARTAMTNTNGDIQAAASTLLENAGM
jgi:protein-tyrosine phosphatase